LITVKTRFSERREKVVVMEKIIDSLMEELKKVVVPSHDNTARGSDGRFETEGVQRLGEEGRGSKGGDVGELGFLNAKN
jgi:hypothetical protein